MCLIVMVSEPYFKSSIPEFMLHLLAIYDLSRFNKIQKFLSKSGGDISSTQPSLLIT